MRVLATADTVGGVWTYAVELAAALADHDVEMHLATQGAPLSDSQRAEAAAIGNLVVHPSEYRLEWMRDPWRDVDAAGEWLRELADDVRPDLVHLNDYSHGAHDWRVPTLMVGHSCVYSWWQAVHRGLPPEEWRVYRERVRAGLQGADRVVAPTAAMLASLLRYYGPFSTGGTIPNGRTPDSFEPARKEPLIFAAGRIWDEAKNLAALADIAPELPWPVAVAGWNRHPDGGELHLPGVRLLGRLGPEAMRDGYGRAAVYCLPARYEPFGLSALEAALAGCALVLGDIPTLREVWGDAARFVSPDDPAALRRALSELIHDEAGREQLARRGRRRALTYSAERMGTAYANLYEELLREHRRSASGGRSATGRWQAVHP